MKWVRVMAGVLGVLLMYGLSRADYSSNCGPQDNLTCTDGTHNYEIIGYYADQAEVTAARNAFVSSLPEYPANGSYAAENGYQGIGDECSGWIGAGDYQGIEVILYDPWPNAYGHAFFLTDYGGNCLEEDGPGEGAAVILDVTKLELFFAVLLGGLVLLWGLRKSIDLVNRS